jgi:hypothetical protein
MKNIIKTKYNICNFFVGMFCGICIMMKMCKKPLIEQKKRGDKNGRLYSLCCKWLNTIQGKGDFGRYLEQKGIHTVAIYGMGGLGKCLLKELENSKIQVGYAIDTQAHNIAGQINLPVYLPEENLPNVQAIIVTPFYEFVSIKDKLEKKIRTEFISIEDIILNIEHMGAINES